MRSEPETGWGSHDPDRSRAVSWRALAALAFVVVGSVTLIALMLIPADVLNPVSRFDTGATALSVGFGVLVLDAVAPVPSSAVMIALGAFAGLGAAAAVSTMGLLGAAIIGYSMGRAGARVVPWGMADAPEWASGSNRRAMAAVIASRPIPLLAETTAMTAGAIRMPLTLFIPSAAAGALVPAVVYAAIGSGLATVPAAWLIPGATIALVALSVTAHRLAVATS